MPRLSPAPRSARRVAVVDTLALTGTALYPRLLRSLVLPSRTLPDAAPIWNIGAWGDGVEVSDLRWIIMQRYTVLC